MGNFSTEGINSEINREKCLRYEIIRYKINSNIRGGGLLLAKAYRLAKMNVVIW